MTVTDAQKPAPPRRHLCPLGRRGCLADSGFTGMITSITSPQNARVKQVVQLAKRNVRDRLGRTVVEGGRELALALQSGVSPFEVFVCPPLLDETSAATSATCYDMARAGQLDILEVTPDVYAKIAFRDSVGGLLAVIPAIGPHAGRPARRRQPACPSGGEPGEARQPRRPASHSRRGRSRVRARLRRRY